jgi:hypothetical protein
VNNQENENINQDLVIVGLSPVNPRLQTSALSSATVLDFLCGT